MNTLGISILLGSLLIVIGLIFRGFLRLFKINNAKFLQAILITVLDIIFLVLIGVFAGKFYENYFILGIGQLIINMIIIGFVLNRIYKISIGKGVLIGFLQHIVIVLVILIINIYVLGFYSMVGSSMNPTFSEGDYLIAEKLTNQDVLKKGDLIVFKTPGKESTSMKRIVGLPGETLKIQDNNVYICANNTCKKITEEYLGKDEKTEPRCGIEEFKINNGYFVMGDNRALSTDSRCCFGLDCFEGTTYEVNYNNVIGKIFIRLFPSFKSF